MKKLKTSRLIIGITLVILATTVLLFIFNIRIHENRYEKIMCYYIARNITTDADTPEKKICALRDFVHMNIKPIAGYENRLDAKAIDKLVSGIGWCDQQARVFMRLARAIGINTRLLFLHSAEGTSPHSVAEAEISSGRWVIVDPLFNLDLRTKKGEMATQQDVSEDLTIITHNDKVRLREPYEKRWSDPNFVSIYYRTPRYVVETKGVSIDLLRFIPLSWIRVVDKYIANRYLSQMRGELKDKFDFKMAKARTYHLIGYYKESELLYREIINTSKNPYLIHKAEYYNALLFKNQKQYKKAVFFLDDIITVQGDNPYKVYDIGLMARILDENGQTEASLKKREAIQYDLVAL